MARAGRSLDAAPPWLPRGPARLHRSERRLHSAAAAAHDLCPLRRQPLLSARPLIHSVAGMCPDVPEQHCRAAGS